MKHITRLAHILLTTAALPTLVLAQDPSAVDERETVVGELLELSAIPSVVGREHDAADYIAGELAALASARARLSRDRIGNVVFTVGSGSPRRLIASPLGEPGFAVSQIQEDGYLRLVPLGERQFQLWDHYHSGQKVVINTDTRGASGNVVGAVAIPSTHLVELRSPTTAPNTFRNAYVDVGAESAAEVAELGIALMNTVTLIKRPHVLAGGTVVAPSAALKAAAIATLEVARLAAQSDTEGTVVFAWTVLDSLNRKGLETVVNLHGPFDEAVLWSDRLRQPGEVRPGPGTGGPHWGTTKIRQAALPATYGGTPVESVTVQALKSAVEDLAHRLGTRAPDASRFALSTVSGASVEDRSEQETPIALLSELVGRYGVSGAEEPVRALVEDRLPEWAIPDIDEAGNLLVSLGPTPNASNRQSHRVFVAHIDEVGYGVDRIREDGRLEVSKRGGFYSWLWEAQAALVHTGGASVPALFEPRSDYLTAGEATATSPLVVSVGATSREQALDLGVEEGVSTVTMPKRLEPLGRHRALARGFDDRVGVAALLLALDRIDPATITRPLTFAFSVEEEVGLIGANVIAQRLGVIEAVFPVDTHVSSDSPRESQSYAYSKLGSGPVLRALESIHFVDPADMQFVQRIAAAEQIPLQIAMTHGGTDGQPFLAYGGRSIPLSWPGRYSHSPVEVMDLRDLDGLVQLIVAIATE